MIGVIVVLVILLVIAIVYSIILYNKIKYYKMAMGNMSAMVIMQKMFEILSSNIPVGRKLEELNNIIIEAMRI